MVPPLRSAGFSDPGWEHGVAQEERKKRVKCNYCGKVVSGGIYRLKQHLARISGQVTHCLEAPEDVYLKMRENLKGCRAIKKHLHYDEDEQPLNSQSNKVEMDADESVGYKRKRNQGADYRSTPLSITPLRSLGFFDPGWEHGVAQDESKKKVKCNYCKRILSGGINRFKQHLARIPGEVAYCQMAPEEVYLKMKENMKWHRNATRRKSDAKSDDEEGLSNCNSMVELLTRGEDIDCSRITRLRAREKLLDSGTNASELQVIPENSDSKNAKVQSGIPIIQSQDSQLKACLDKRGHKEVTSAICKFFYHLGIPPSVADSPYFHKMLDLVGRHGPGLKSPPARLIAGRLLQHEVSAVKEYLMEAKASWSTTGCSILADTWTDLRGRILIMFLVSCPRGTHFISSVDASDIVEDVPSLFKLLDQVVEEVGEENVVQVITQNTVSYKAAGKMLEEKRKHLFWTPCAAYSIDKILEDFMKIKWVAECIDKGQRITKFIYSHGWLLNLMKKEFTAGKDLLKPAATRSASSFATIQSLIEHKSALKRVFQSDKWISSGLAKIEEGKEVKKIVLSPTFWKKMNFVQISVDPVVNVLKNVGSSNGLSMPSVYNDMYHAKLAIKAAHGDEQGKYDPFWNVIDNHWNSIFNHPLYVAGYFLNPAYRYRLDFMPIPEVIRGLNECITRLEPDTGRMVTAATQISDFVFAKDDFGTELAVSTRLELDPASWWQQHGINCLELRRIAVLILSQTCICIGCEKSPSLFDQIPRARNNHRAQKCVADLTYVHYNLRLRDRHLKSSDDAISLNDFLLKGLLDDWIDETGYPENEEITYNELEESETCEDESIEQVGCNAEPMEMVEKLKLHPRICANVDEADGGLHLLDDKFSD